MSEYQKDEHDMPPLTRKKRLMLYFFPLRLLYSPLRLVFTLVLCIFTVEFLIMVGLHNIPRLTPIIEYFLDAFLLSVVLCPVFIVLLLRPLKHLIAQYQLSENQLRGHKEHLAQDVKARTAALVSAIQQLKGEIIERMVDRLIGRSRGARAPATGGDEARLAFHAFRPCLDECGRGGRRQREPRSRQAAGGCPEGHRHHRSSGRGAAGWVAGV